MKKLYRTIPVIKDLLFILKNIDEKRRRNLYYFAFISGFNAFVEIIFLNTFSGFISYLISLPSESIENFNANNSLIIIQRIYSVIYQKVN